MIAMFPAPLQAFLMILSVSVVILFLVTMLGGLGIACAPQQPAVQRDPPGIAPPSARMPDGNTWTTTNLTIDSDGSYCYNNSDVHCQRYGRLYTWEAALAGCRALGMRWRLPTDDDWRRLASFYGGISETSADRGKAAYAALIAGGQSGFGALLGGGRDAPDGRYARIEAHGFYWTATASDATTAVYYNFGRGGPALHRQADGLKDRAHSVRCVRSDR